MRVLALVAASGLALTACAGIMEKTGYTEEQQVCIANATLAAWKSLPADMEIPKKLLTVTNIVSETCGLTSTPVLASEVQEAAPLPE